MGGIKIVSSNEGRAIVGVNSVSPGNKTKFSRD